MIVIGVGNPLRGDDGIGPFIIEELRRRPPRDGIEIYDGGTDAFSVMEKIREHPKALIIDAARMSGNPGDVKILRGREIRLRLNRDSMSTHGFGLAEMMSLMESLDIETDVSVIGVEPERTGFDPGLSETVKSRVGDILDLIDKETADVLRHSG